MIDAHPGSDVLSTCELLFEERFNRRELRLDRAVNRSHPLNSSRMKRNGTRCDGRAFEWGGRDSS
jgi:hypothetical protein